MRAQARTYRAPVLAPLPPEATPSSQHDPPRPNLG